MAAVLYTTQDGHGQAFCAGCLPEGITAESDGVREATAPVVCDRCLTAHEPRAGRAGQAGCENQARAEAIALKREHERDYMLWGARRRAGFLRRCRGVRERARFEDLSLDSQRNDELGIEDPDSIDFEAVGALHRAANGGQFTEYGYYCQDS